MKINLKKLLYVQIYLIFIIRFIVYISGITYLSYICDAINVLILFFLIKYYRKNKMKIIVIFFIVQLIYWIITYWLGSMTNISLFFVMIRELVRFYIVFLAAGICMEKEDYEKIFKIFDIALFIHTFLIIIQLYVLKIKNIDAIGGIFGISYGYGNSTSHTFLIFILIITLYKYFNKSEKLHFSILKILLIIIIGMMTEMKSIIYEVTVIILLFLALNKKINLKYLILIGSFILIFLGFSDYINKYFNFNIFSLEEIVKYLES